MNAVPITVARDATRVVVRQPAHGKHPLNLRVLWEYRELLYFMTWKDLKVRYKQTVFGLSWAVLQPFLTMVVFTLFFGRLAKIPSDGVAYPVFSFAALVPWTLFSNGITQASNSLVSSATPVSYTHLTLPTN